MEVNPLAIARVAADRLEQSIQERRGITRRISQVGEGESLRRFDPPLVAFLDNAFGIRVQPGTPPIQLEVIVDGNYKLELRRGETRRALDQDHYWRGLAAFYEKQAQSTLRAFSRQEDPLSYEGVLFPNVFHLVGVTDRPVRDVQEGEKRKVRDVIEVTFAVMALPACDDLQEALTEGVYLYCARGFIAHHIGYAKRVLGQKG